MTNKSPLKGILDIIKHTPHISQREKVYRMKLHGVNIISEKVDKYLAEDDKISAIRQGRSTNINL